MDERTSTINIFNLKFFEDNVSICCASQKSSSAKYFKIHVRPSQIFSDINRFERDVN